ncbi:hypothetical protein KSP39_PZI016922 [Platanthera zijinensis]|uniref:Transcription repressor n=1 Tax=Platanthera zijinensis TaxID=2320716 RepID=A0AAP0G0U1_9ASPA
MPTKKKMKKGFHKSFKVYFSKLKSMPSSLGHLSATTTSSSGSIFSACKYPKTPSFVGNRKTDGNAAAAATLSDVDRFLHENFHSLYFCGGNDDPPPAVIRKSDRLFLSKGSTSGSLEADGGGRLTSRAESMSPTPSPNSKVGSAEVAGGGVALTTFSKNPYEDFRRSMQEMMDGRHVEPLQPLDWDFMEELLFCYLDLNNRNVHKYILQAFTDLTVRFRLRDEERSCWNIPARRRRIVRPESVAGPFGDDSGEITPERE